MNKKNVLIPLSFLSSVWLCNFWDFGTSGVSVHEDPTVKSSTVLLSLKISGLRDFFRFSGDSFLFLPTFVTKGTFHNFAISRVRESKTLDSSSSKRRYPRCDMGMAPSSLAPATYNRRLGLSASTSRNS
jgi:hypothetical protein